MKIQDEDFVDGKLTLRQITAIVYFAECRLREWDEYSEEADKLHEIMLRITEKDNKACEAHFGAD